MHVYKSQPSIVPFTSIVYLICDEICTRIMISNDGTSPSTPDSSICSSTSITDISHSDVSIIYSSSSPARGIKPTESHSTYTSVSIKRSLLHDQTHYRVVSNNSKCATASCWKIFGFPAVVPSQNENQFEIVHGYAARKNCFETHRFIGSSTANLNSHVCPRMLPSNLPTRHKLSRTTLPPIDQKLFHSFLVIFLFFINSTPIQ